MGTHTARPGDSSAYADYPQASPSSAFMHVHDWGPGGPGPLARAQEGRGRGSPSGCFGAAPSDARARRLASCAGRIATNAMMQSEPERAPAARGRYDIGPVVGQGGAATIHRVYDRLTGRELAYKRLRLPDSSMRTRMTNLFRREFDIIARLEHPNIVRVYDFGIDAHVPYYTMELVSGADLARLARPSVPDACRILRDVASALALLHARRQIHRDVTPANVRLSHTNVAKLIDFGALMPFGVSTEVVGTPPFIAMECLTREPLDQGVDLYAFGALAYWILTRQLPVRASSLSELPAAWTLPVVPPSALRPEIPRSSTTWCSHFCAMSVQLARPRRVRSWSD